MRIADKMQFEQVKTNIGKNRTQMSELQNQAASQKRVNKPSDDPLAASRVLSNRIDLQGNKQYGKNLTYAKSFLEYTDQSLGELTEVMVRAKELALSQSSDGASNEQSRRAVATELEQLFNQMVAIGNRKLGDRFIFGGFSTQNSPFDEKGEYAGDSGEMMIHIDKETFIPMNVTGARIFLGEGISPDGMVKSGPAQAKTIEELEERQLHAKQTAESQRMQQQASPSMRGPASVNPAANGGKVLQPRGGLNLFSIVNDLMVGLQTDDKAAVQGTLEDLDLALQQVVLTRAQVGSRGTIIDNFTATNEKMKVENRAAISSLEDADVFSTVSDITKTESALQATLETSGKLIQPSLLQFLR